MATTFYDPAPVPLGRAPVGVVVCRLSAGRLSVMPNVRFLGARYEEGKNPGQATYRYAFDRGGAIDVGAEWPASPEEVSGPQASGPFVAMPDDRLCTYFVDDGGDPTLIFDGFVSQSASTISADRGRLEATFSVKATPIREWDTPLVGRYQRDATDPEDKSGDKPTMIPIVFNPKGVGNATPKDFDGTSGSFDHPVFVDELWQADTGKGRLWSVPMAVKYILARGNSDETYVKNPRFSVLDGLLDAREPSSGQAFDSGDATTYTSKPIILKELDINGLTWPDALDAVLTRYGFRFVYALAGDSNGLPSWTLVIYRTQDPAPEWEKQIYIQAGGDLDPARTNVGEMHIVRDPADVANSYVVESALVEFEGAYVLAPGYRPVAADATNPAQFDSTASTYVGNETKYRRYLFDECGEGHWDWKTSDWLVGKPPTLKYTLGGSDVSESNYVRRRRPVKDALFSKSADNDGDGDGEARKAQLLISWDYKGLVPGQWDGTGTWFPVSRNWRLLTDRLGIYLDCKSPEAWSIANKKVTFGVNVKSSAGVVKGVSAQALAGETRFHLMLAAVMEGDQLVSATADRRAASPSRFTIRRVVDAQNMYKYQGILKNSYFNQDNDAVATRDDTEAAKDDAIARRTDSEMVKVAGPVTVPRITVAYQVGDRLTDVVGRDQSLRSNVGDSGGEAPSYPRVVAVEFNCDGGQSTTIHVEDDRGVSRARHGRRRRG